MSNFFLINKLKEKTNNISKNSGQAMLFSVVLFIFITLTTMAGLVSPTVRDYRIVRDSWLSGRSYYLAESGVEDVYYRLLQNLPLINTGSYNLSLGYDSANVEIDSMVDGQINVISSANISNRNRKIVFEIQVPFGIVFQSGLQFGKGGLLAQGGNSSVFGTITSQGPVTGSNSNIVNSGGITSSGSSGLISNLRIINSSYNAVAHTIINSVIAGSAYYQSIDGTSLVSGALCPNPRCFDNSPDTQEYPLPITDSAIEFMEQAALAGGIYKGVCPYNLNTNTVLGPIMINCDSVNISDTAQVTINGPVWVKGNINMTGSSRLLVGPSIPVGSSVMVIADKPTNRTTSSQISINTRSASTGIGPDSFVVLVSQNNDAENGGAMDAVDLISTGSSASALIVYAPHGHIDVQSNDEEGFTRITSGYKATLTSMNTILSSRSTTTTVSFSPILYTWDIKEWKEI